MDPKTEVEAFKSVQMMQTYAEEIDTFLLTDGADEIIAEMGFDPDDLFRLWEPFRNRLAIIANKAHNQIYLSRERRRLNYGSENSNESV